MSDPGPGPLATGGQVEAIADHFELRFIEGPIKVDEGTRSLVVEVEARWSDDEKGGYAGLLVFSVDEWDRVWRSLVDSTGAFEKRGIQLVRTHGPGRF